MGGMKTRMTTMINDRKERRRGPNKMHMAHDTMTSDANPGHPIYSIKLSFDYPLHTETNVTRIKDASLTETHSLSMDSDQSVTVGDT